MENNNELIKERDDMIYGRTQRNEKRIKEINKEIQRIVIQE